MDIQQGNQYLISREGEQFGPVPGGDMVQLANKRQILPTDHIWTDRMPNWVPASSLNQLRPVFAALEANTKPAAPSIGSNALFASNPIAAQAEREHDEENVHTEVDQAGRLHVDRNEVHGPGLVHAKIHTPNENKEVTPNRPGVSFGLLLFSYLLMVFGGIGYVIMMFSVLVRPIEVDPEEISAPGFEFFLDRPVLFISIMGAFVIGALLNTILSLSYLHRAWSYLQDLPNVTTTAGKAVGFLLVPVLNLVWLFIAYYKWAGDYNLRCDLSNRKQNPKVNEGLFMTHCITSLLGLPILYIFMMYQMCRAINHLASSPNLNLVSSY